MMTAKSARTLLSECDGLEPTPMVSAIAKVKLETSNKAVARSIESVDKVLSSLRSPNRWELFEAVAQISDKRKTDATMLMDDLRSWLMMDEFALAGGIAEKLSEAEGRAIQLLRPPKQPETRTEVEPVPPTVPKPGWKRISAGTEERLSKQDLTSTTQELNEKLTSNPKYRVTLHWTIEEDES